MSTPPNITNKAFKKKPWLETFTAWCDWIFTGLPGPCGKIIPFYFPINLQKGGMIIYLLAEMIYFDNWTLGSWLYLALHGSYGMFWIFKDYTFPDASF